jgi:hypothetical protein
MHSDSQLASHWVFLCAGIATYCFYLHRGERHLYPWNYIYAVILLQFGLTTFLTTFGEIRPLSAAVGKAAECVSIYLLGIYASLIIFRVSLNPLNKFPGNRLARLSALHHTLQVGRKMDMYLHLQEAHRKWGDFVRIGPNTISVADPLAVRVALGAQSKCTKAPWYSIEHPSYSMHSTRSKADHDSRRRIWSPAFSDKALRGYEKRVHNYNQELIQQIDSFSGEKTSENFGLS